MKSGVGLTGSSSGFTAFLSVSTDWRGCERLHSPNTGSVHLLFGIVSFCFRGEMWLKLIWRTILTMDIIGMFCFPYHFMFSGCGATRQSVVRVWIDSYVAATYLILCFTTIGICFLDHFKLQILIWILLVVF